MIHDDAHGVIETGERTPPGSPAALRLLAPLPGGVRGIPAAAPTLLRLQRAAGNAAVGAALRTGVLAVAGTGPRTATSSADGEGTRLLLRDPRVHYQPGERRRARQAQGIAAAPNAGPDLPPRVYLVNFGPGSAELSGDQTTELLHLLEHEHLATRGTVTSILGYTDAVDDEATNAPLRAARARAVADFLVAHGLPELPPGAVGPAPAGSYPGDNASAEGRAANRGVVLQITTRPPPPPPPPPTPPPRTPTCTPAAHCPRNFCVPMGRTAAEFDRQELWLGLLLGILATVHTTRVRDLWRDYMFGGSPPRDLTSRFANDFASTPTTWHTTEFLRAEIIAAVQRSPPTFPPGATSVSLPLESLIPGAIAAIDVPDGFHEMNFNDGHTIAGNIAGSVDKNEAACRFGARPSPFDDERRAEGTVVVTTDASGNLTVAPVITYTVRDTIDLCSGDCGGAVEWTATLPLSRWEATGISGDVPFTVRFAGTPAPFRIPAHPAAHATPQPAPQPHP